MTVPASIGAGIYPLEFKEFSCREGHPKVQKRAHWHNEVELNLLTEGQMTYLWHGHLEKITSPALVLFWGGIPHQLIKAEGSPNCYWMYIPLACLLGWDLPGPFVKALLKGQIFRHALDRAGPPALILAMMAQWCRELAANDRDLERTVLIEVQAHLQRFARHASGRKLTQLQMTEQLSGPLERLEAMINFIALNFREPMRLKDIAAAAQLHPNYACAFFKKASGMSVNNYLTQLRLSHAKRLLVTTNATIVTVALESGFGSVSPFYAAFGKSCGLSPVAYRRQHKPLVHTNQP